MRGGRASVGDVGAGPRGSVSRRSWTEGIGHHLLVHARRGCMRVGGHREAGTRDGANDARESRFRFFPSYFPFYSLVGSGAVSDRPASAGRGGHERSLDRLHAK